MTASILKQDPNIWKVQKNTKWQFFIGAQSQMAVSLWAHKQLKLYQATFFFMTVNITYAGTNES